MNAYDDIYALKPDYECEPGWWKLKWKPIWGLTYRFYRLVTPTLYVLGLSATPRAFHNGWGRSIKRKYVRILIFNREYGFWIRYDYRVMAEGPLDQNPPRPLDLPKKGETRRHHAQGKVF